MRPIRGFGTGQFERVFHPSLHSDDVVSVTKCSERECPLPVKRVGKCVLHMPDLIELKLLAFEMQKRLNLRNSLRKARHRNSTKESTMSWSVSAQGSIETVKAEMDRQFAYPLAEKPQGLADDGERVTVAKIQDVVNQCLSTFAPEKQVSVSANGHMGFADWSNKTGAYQNVNLTIKTLEL